MANNACQPIICLSINQLLNNLLYVMFIYGLRTNFALSIAQFILISYTTVSIMCICYQPNNQRISNLTLLRKEKAQPET